MSRTDNGLPGIYNSSPITLPTGRGSALAVDSSGRLIVSPTAGGSDVNIADVGGTAVVTAGVNGLLAVGGNVASGATDSGNPVKVGGRYNSTPPTLTNGQRGDLQLDSSGRLITNNAPLTGTADSIAIYDGTNTLTVATQNSTTAAQTGLLAQTATTTAAPTYTTARTNPLSTDTAGNLRTIDSNTSGLLVGQTSTTSGQNGVLMQGSVTTAAPTYTTAQTSPLSLTTTGLLRVGGSPTASAVPATGFYQAIRSSGGNLIGLGTPAAVGFNNIDLNLGGLSVQQYAYTGVPSGSDAVRNNTTGVVIAAGTTSTQSNIALTTYNARSLTLVISITAATVATLTVTVNGTTSSSYTFLLGASTALATISTNTLAFGPGLPATANSSFNIPLPRNVTVTATVTGTIAYGIDYALSV